jgi:hypothetical protein
MKNAIKTTDRFVRNQLVAQLGRAIAEHEHVWTAHASEDSDPKAEPVES